MMAALGKATSAFLTDSIQKMFSTKPTHKKWTNWKVGLSCFAYLAPAIVIWLIAMNTRYCFLYEFTLYIVVTFNSFVADYIMMGKVSVCYTCINFVLLSL